MNLLADSISLVKLLERHNDPADSYHMDKHEVVCVGHAIADPDAAAVDAAPADAAAAPACVVAVVACCVAVVASIFNQYFFNNLFEIDI